MHYICVLLDFFTREIIGSIVGKNRNEELIGKALSRVEVSLEEIQIFHTDRGIKFKYRLWDEMLETFHSQHSLHIKGCPYDNVIT